jgi:FKBP-type peptidyl-prolyl cis-trans isomerase
VLSVQTAEKNQLDALKATQLRGDKIRLHEKPPDDPTKAPREVKTQSGLRYLDLKTGTGVEAKPGRKVKVHYTGWLKSGKKFDSSHYRQQPFEFDLGAGQVISGLDEGIAGMKVGGKRKLIIPPHPAYGERGVGREVPPNAELTFEMELLGVK